MDQDARPIAFQGEKLKRLWHSLNENDFYQRKLQGFTWPEHAEKSEDALQAWFRTLPFTTKQELAEDRANHPPYGSNLSLPLHRYSRFCQSSGTTAGPIPVLDTTESWSSMLDIWELVYQEAEIGVDQSMFFAFSYGPFLGFWTAFEAATRRGNLCIPGGGLSSSARLQLLATYQPQVLCCTPTYAIRLGELFAEADDSLRSQIRIRTIIVGGEPGGSIPSTRERISALWLGARVIDHHGMTEVGPVTIEPRDRPCSLVVEESAFIAEILDSKSDREVESGQEGELVLTTLNRVDKPLIRYRTGDLVKKCYHKNRLCLEGGILGRIDDMILVRGVNVYPSAIEQILRGFDEIVEYSAEVSQHNAMTELDITVELAADAPEPETVREHIEAALSDAFALRIPVHRAEPGSLPRYEFKSKRWIIS